MKAHIGVDVASGLVHTAVGTAANEADIAQMAALLHGEEDDVFGDAGGTGADKRPEPADRDVSPAFGTTGNITILRRESAPARHSSEFS